MSTQIKRLEINEDRYKVDNPCYGAKDYAFTFEFTGVQAVWQAHDVDSASLVAKPNIWMGERAEDHYSVVQRQDGADERVFAYREGRSFTLVCLNDQLYLMLRIWEEDKNGNVLSASRRAKSALKVATCRVSGKTEPLIISHEVPCVIKLETQDGLSLVKVWNTQNTEEVPFILGDFGEDFRDFFSGFIEFQFNTIPDKIKNGQHALHLRRVAAWTGNAQPEGEKNFKDYLDKQAPVLKCFAYRQLPLERLSGYYPLQKNRWAALDNKRFHCVENSHFEIEPGRGLSFETGQNKCSVSLRPSGAQGASSSCMLDIALNEARLPKITTLGEQIGELSKSESLFSKRTHWLQFKKILEAIEAFDPAKPVVPSPHYTDGTVAAVIKTGALLDKLPNFMHLLEASNFESEHQLKNTISDLQVKLNEDKEKLYTRRENIGILTCKTATPASDNVFNIQIVRRMKVDSSNGGLSYEAQVVFADDKGNDHGSIDLKDFPGFLLLSLSDDRKEFNLFFTPSGNDFSSRLTPALTYGVSPDVDNSASHNSQKIDDVTLAFGLGGASLDGAVNLSVKGLSLWNVALWRRKGLITTGEELDEDYNVKTLAYLSFAGLLEPLLRQYQKSLAI